MNIGFLSHLDLNLYLFRLPLMKELIERGHHVFAIVPSGEYSEKFAEYGIVHVSYDIERESLNPFKEYRFMKNIYSVIKPLDLDMLHTFTAKPNIYGTFAAKRAGIPTVLNLVEGLGSFYVDESIKSRLVRRVMEKLYQKAFSLSDGCVFVNSDDPDYMVKRGIISKDHVKVIKSVGVDTAKFSMEKYSAQEIESIKKELGLQNKTIVLMVARAIWDKGLKEFYEAAEIISKKYDSVAFVLVGGTDPGNHTCASEDFLRSGSVKWLGQRNDMVDLTAISDIYVLPSYREGVPVTLLEAASMSKPIVTTDTVGCREVVEEGYNGFLVPVKNSTALSDKIEILLNDASLREHFGSNSRKKAEKEFAVEKVVAQYMEYYHEKGIL